jgi:hypothetical protein
MAVRGVGEGGRVEAEFLAVEAVCIVGEGAGVGFGYDGFVVKVEIVEIVSVVVIFVVV